jgi:hypothetical protein
MIVPLYGADDIFSEMSFVICEQLNNSKILKGYLILNYFRHFSHRLMMNCSGNSRDIPICGRKNY